MSDVVVSERVERLLPSQRFWMLSPHREKIIMAGYRAGKTRVGCLTGFLLSYLNPGNYGFIGRAFAKDIAESTLKTFTEVCPPEFILGKPQRRGQSGLVYRIRSKDPARPSEIYFDYIIDKQSGRSHLAGGNWGWFFVDQVEEISRFDWAKLTGRLSRMHLDPATGQRAPMKTYALGAGNQVGHDWVWEDFFSQEVHGTDAKTGDFVFNVAKEPKKFFKAVHRDLPVVNGKTFARLGVITRAEENKVSNGGFVSDDYYDGQRASQPREWVARYLDGSFDDFSGKIYADFNLTSVHNIESFNIPPHWPCYGYIDPGGSAPWAIGKVYVDELGNKVVVDCADEIYNKTRLNPNEAAKWIHKNFVVLSSRFVIDYQNIPVMELFRDEGIHCEPAMKDIKVGVHGTMEEFYVNPERPLPKWFERTQPKEAMERFAGKGSPRVFVFKTCKSFRNEHDNAIWDPKKPNVPKDGENHHFDGFRYLCASNPASAIPLQLDPYGAFRDLDPISAQHQDYMTRKVAQVLRRDKMKHWEQEDAAGDSGEIDMGTESYIEEFGGMA